MGGHEVWEQRSSQSGAVLEERGREPEEVRMRPSCAFFSPLSQSNPCPTQERVEEADGRGCKAPPQRLTWLLICNPKVHGKGISLIVSKLIRQSVGQSSHQLMEGTQEELQ